MKKTSPKSFLNTDKNFQLILIVSIVGSYFLGISYPYVHSFLGMLFLFLVVWQLFSVIYLSIQYNDDFRKLYLKIVLGWIVLIGLMLAVKFVGLLWIVVVFWMPLCLMIFYFGITYTDWKKSRSLSS